jgi:hypothetical protein
MNIINLVEPHESVPVNLTWKDIKELTSFKMVLLLFQIVVLVIVVCCLAP